MDIRQLKYFVAVAQELNFSRAALRLHMSQPPLSQHIKALEDELGVVLLLRSKREVKLTDAGHVFLAKSLQLIEQLQQAVDATIRAGVGDAGEIRLGMTTSAVYHVMPDVLQRLQRHCPTVKPLVTDMRSMDQIRAIKNGKLDIGIIHEHPHIEKLSYKRLFAEPFCLVVPEGYTRGNSANIDLAECAGDAFVFFSRDYAPVLYDGMYATCLKAGFEPLIAHTARHALTIFQMVRLGLGVALIPQSFSSNTTPGIRYLRLNGAANGVCIGAVWDANNPSDIVNNVVKKIFLHID